MIAFMRPRQCRLKRIGSEPTSREFIEGFAQDISHLHSRVRQRLAARQLIGRLSNARIISATPPSDHEGREKRHLTNSLGPACGLRAVLGLMPWSRRATAFRPDSRNMTWDSQKFKGTGRIAPRSIGTDMRGLQKSCAAKQSKGL